LFFEENRPAETLVVEAVHANWSPRVKFPANRENIKESLGFGYFSMSQTSKMVTLSGA
jgi:hypothetical protein